jgi:N-acetylneuraminic acid mutarotase
MDSRGGMGFDYDPASDTWVRKNIRPSFEFSTSNAVNGKCYGIGGGYFEGLSGALFDLPWLTVYDPKTDTSRLPQDDPLTTTTPVHRVGHGSAVVGGKIYVLGGASRINFIYNVPGSGGSIPKLGPLKSALFIYDPVNGSWSTGSDMPTPRVLMGVTAMDGFIYAAGGAVLGEAGPLGSIPVPTDIVERYDPAKDSWTTLASMTTKRWGLSVNAVDGALYAIGGSITSGWGADTVATVERYNPKRDKWDTRADMSEKRWLHTSQKVDGQIYVVGGWRRLAETSSGQTAFSTLLTEQYTP